ncbi:MAG: hypothetical protein HQ558_02240, partial [Candidatus Omnitrophica bacterium]|nr:hypothetical protein [Candidatus Omnitrophota bacterium]
LLAREEVLYAIAIQELKSAEFAAAQEKQGEPRKELEKSLSPEGEELKPQLDRRGFQTPQPEEPKSEKSAKTESAFESAIEEPADSVDEAPAAEEPATAGPATELPANFIDEAAPEESAGTEVTASAIKSEAGPGIPTPDPEEPADEDPSEEEPPASAEPLATPPSGVPVPPTITREETVRKYLALKRRAAACLALMPYMFDANRQASLMAEYDTIATEFFAMIRDLPDEVMLDVLKHCREVLATTFPKSKYPDLSFGERDDMLLADFNNICAEFANPHTDRSQDLSGKLYGVLYDGFGTYLIRNDLLTEIEFDLHGFLEEHYPVDEETLYKLLRLLKEIRDTHSVDQLRDPRPGVKVKPLTQALLRIGWRKRRELMALINRIKPEQLRRQIFAEVHRVAIATKSHPQMDERGLKRLTGVLNRPFHGARKADGERASKTIAWGEYVWEGIIAYLFSFGCATQDEMKRGVIIEKRGMAKVGDTALGSLPDEPEKAPVAEAGKPDPAGPGKEDKPAPEAAASASDKAVAEALAAAANIKVPAAAGSPKTSVLAELAETASLLRTSTSASPPSRGKKIESIAKPQTTEERSRIFCEEDYAGIARNMRDSLRIALRDPEVTIIHLFKVGINEDQRDQECPGLMAHRLMLDWGIEPMVSQEETAQIFESAVENIGIRAGVNPDKTPWALEVDVSEEAARGAAGVKLTQEDRKTFFILIRREGAGRDAWAMSDFLSEDELRQYLPGSNRDINVAAKDLAVLIQEGRALVCGMDYVLPHKRAAEHLARIIADNPSEADKIARRLGKNLRSPTIEELLERSWRQRSIIDIVTDRFSSCSGPVSVEFVCGMHTDKPVPIDLDIFEKMGFESKVPLETLGALLVDDIIEGVRILQETEVMPAVLEVMLMPGHEMREMSLPADAPESAKRLFSFFIWDAATGDAIRGETAADQYMQFIDSSTGALARDANGRPLILQGVEDGRVKVAVPYHLTDKEEFLKAASLLLATERRREEIRKSMDEFLEVLPPYTASQLVPGMKGPQVRFEIDTVSWEEIEEGMRLAANGILPPKGGLYIVQEPYKFFWIQRGERPPEHREVEFPVRILDRRASVVMDESVDGMRLCNISLHVRPLLSEFHNLLLSMYKVLHVAELGFKDVAHESEGPGSIAKGLLARYFDGDILKQKEAALAKILERHEKVYRAYLKACNAIGMSLLFRRVATLDENVVRERIKEIDKWLKGFLEKDISDARQRIYEHDDALYSAYREFKKALESVGPIKRVEDRFYEAFQEASKRTFAGFAMKTYETLFGDGWKGPDGELAEESKEYMDALSSFDKGIIIRIGQQACADLLKHIDELFDAESCRAEYDAYRQKMTGVDLDMLENLHAQRAVIAAHSALLAMDLESLAHERECHDLESDTEAVAVALRAIEGHDEPFNSRLEELASDYESGYTEGNYELTEQVKQLCDERIGQIDSYIEERYALAFVANGISSIRVRQILTIISARRIIGEEDRRILSIIEKSETEPVSSDDLESLIVYKNRLITWIMIACYAKAEEYINTRAIERFDIVDPALPMVEYEVSREGETFTLPKAFNDNGFLLKSAGILRGLGHASIEGSTGKLKAAEDPRFAERFLEAEITGEVNIKDSQWPDLACVYSHGAQAPLSTDIKYLSNGSTLMILSRDVETPDLMRARFYRRHPLVSTAKLHEVNKVVMRRFNSVIDGSDERLKAFTEQRMKYMRTAGNGQHGAKARQTVRSMARDYSLQLANYIKAEQDLASSDIDLEADLCNAVERYANEVFLDGKENGNLVFNVGLFDIFNARIYMSLMAALTNIYLIDKGYILELKDVALVDEQGRPIDINSIPVTEEAKKRITLARVASDRLDICEASGTAGQRLDTLLEEGVITEISHLETLLPTLPILLDEDLMPDAELRLFNSAFLQHSEGRERVIADSGNYGRFLDAGDPRAKAAFDSSLNLALLSAISKGGKTETVKALQDIASKVSERGGISGQINITSSHDLKPLVAAAYQIDTIKSASSGAARDTNFLNLYDSLAKARESMSTQLPRLEAIVESDANISLEINQRVDMARSRVKARKQKQAAEARIRSSQTLESVRQEIEARIAQITEQMPMLDSVLANVAGLRGKVVRARSADNWQLRRLEAVRACEVNAQQCPQLLPYSEAVALLFDADRALPDGEKMAEDKLRQYLGVLNLAAQTVAIWAGEVEKIEDLEGIQAFRKKAESNMEERLRPLGDDGITTDEMRGVFLSDIERPLKEKEAKLQQAKEAAEELDRVQELGILSRLEEIRGLIEAEDFGIAQTRIDEALTEYPDEKRFKKQQGTLDKAKQQAKAAEQAKKDDIGLKLSQIREAIGAGKYQEVEELISAARTVYDDEQCFVEAEETLKLKREQAYMKKALQLINRCIELGRLARAESLTRNFLMRYPSEEEVLSAKLAEIQEAQETVQEREATILDSLGQIQTAIRTESFDSAITMLTTAKRVYGGDERFNALDEPLAAALEQLRILFVMEEADRHLESAELKEARALVEGELARDDPAVEAEAEALLKGKLSKITDAEAAAQEREDNITDRLRTIRSHIDAKDFEDARLAIVSAKDEYPKETRFAEIEESLKKAEQAASAAKNALLVDSYLTLARKHLDEADDKKKDDGEISKAEDALKEARALDSSHPGLAELDKRLKVLKDYIAKLALAHELFSKGDLNEAGVIVEVLLLSSRKDPVLTALKTSIETEQKIIAHLRSAEEFAKEEMFEDAIEEIDKALAIDSAHTAALDLRSTIASEAIRELLIEADCYLSRGEYTDACAVAEKARRFNPSDKRISAFELKAHQDDAIQAAKVDQLLKRAASLAHSGKPVEALTRLDEAKEVDPENVEIQSQKAMVLLDIAESHAQEADMESAAVKVDEAIAVEASGLPDGRKQKHMVHLEGFALSVVEAEIREVDLGVRRDVNLLNSIVTTDYNALPAVVNIRRRVSELERFTWARSLNVQDAIDGFNDSITSIVQRQQNAIEAIKRLRGFKRAYAGFTEPEDQHAAIDQAERDLSLLEKEMPFDNALRRQNYNLRRDIRGFIDELHRRKREKKDEELRLKREKEAEERRQREKKEAADRALSGRARLAALVKELVAGIDEISSMGELDQRRQEIFFQMDSLGELLAPPEIESYTDEIGETCAPKQAEFEAEQLRLKAEAEAKQRALAAEAAAKQRELAAQTDAQQHKATAEAFASALGTRIGQPAQDTPEAPVPQKRAGGPKKKTKKKTKAPKRDPKEPAISAQEPNGSGGSGKQDAQSAKNAMKGILSDIEAATETLRKETGPKKVQVTTFDAISHLTSNMATAEEVAAAKERFGLLAPLMMKAGLVTPTERTTLQSWIRALLAREKQIKAQGPDATKTSSVGVGCSPAQR